MKNEIMEMLQGRLNEANKDYDLTGSSESFAVIQELEEIILKVEKMK